jgi:peptidoglycan/xylan/chitin deacetylase (PgdA/CDA1 family)
LTYHRVFDAPEVYHFDRGVIDVGPEAFDAQLKVLSRYFNVVGIDEVCAHYAGEEKLPPNAAVVTFDDGYLDNLEVAAPILKDNGMRGVFFIATTYIEDRRVYWWDRINYLLHHAEPGRRCVELEYPTRLTLDLDNDREGALGTLLQLLKIQFNLDVERVLDELAAGLGVAWDRDLERELTDGFVMTWDQVRALRKMGMDIGSHTRSHRALQTVPHGELVGELSGAKQDLERELGEPVHSISYPIGRSIANLDPIRQALRDAGFKVGFTNASGAQPLWGESDCYDLRRIAVEPEYQGSFFRGVLALPQLGYDG